MHENQWVANQWVAKMAEEPLPNNQAGFRAELNKKPLEEVPNEPHRDESAERWQEDFARELAEEQKRLRLEERKQLERDAAWEQFMQTERRELELRRDGQLKHLLGEPLPGEPLEALWRLTYEDRRQAEEGLVALMSGGKLSYKPLEELSPEDMPARIAAERLRTTWLKKRQDGWLARGEGSL